MEKLTSRERILNTIEGRPVDRIPIWPPIPWHPLAPGPPEGDWKLQPNYLAILDKVKEHCDFLVNLMIPEGRTHESSVEEYARRAAYGGIFDRRFFLSPPELISSHDEIDESGSKVTTYTLQTPKGDLRMVERIDPGIDTTWLTEPLVKTTDDAEKLLSVPYRFDPPDLDSFFADVQKLGERGVPVIFITSPMVMVSHMTDLQRFLEWSMLEKPLVDRMIQTIYEREVERLQYILDKGVDAIIRFGGSEQATPPLMPHSFFEEFILQYEKPLWQLAQKAGKHVWVHCHGKISSVIDDFIEGGVKLTDPVEPPPQGDIEIGEAKRRARKGPMTLVGNIEHVDFYKRTPEEMEKLVEEAVCTEGKEYLILGHSDFLISEINEKTRDNCISYIESGIKYGRSDI